MTDRHMQIRGGQIKDGTISEVKLDVSNAPVDGYFLRYNSTEEKFEWVAGNDAVTEAPVGLINGVNPSYVITNVPQTGSLHLYLNGIFQEEGSGKDYQLSGTSIVFNQAPETDDNVIATYLKVVSGASEAHTQGTDTTLGAMTADLDMNNHSINNVNVSSIGWNGGGSITKADYDAAIAHKDSETNPHAVDKADVGLSNVPNVDTTSAINDSHAHTNKAELDLVTDGNHDVRTDNPHSVTKTDVALENVTNEAQIPLTQKGALNGVAELDAAGKVLTSQLPSYVDDTLEYANLAGFPVTGETGKIYIALDTNIIYRWSGTLYVEISSSLALGETSATAYRGDRGKEAYDNSHVQGTDTTLGAMTADINMNSNKLVNLGGATLTGVLFVNDATDKVVPMASQGTANQVLVSNGSGVLPTFQDKENEHLRFTIIDPALAYGVDTKFCLIPVTSKAMTIVNIEVTCDADPSTEITGDLKYANAFIGLASATVIRAIDTANGVSHSGAISVAVASGKCIYLSFDTIPNASIKSISFDVTYKYNS